MTEKQREEELFKRAERREELKKRFEISQKLKLQQKKKERSDEQSMDSDSDAGDNFSGAQANSDYQGRRKGYEEKHAKKSCHSHVCVGVCGSKVLGGVRYRELDRRWEEIFPAMARIVILSSRQTLLSVDITIRLNNLHLWKAIYI